MCFEKEFVQLHCPEGIEVVLDPDQRLRRLEEEYRLKGLKNVQEHSNYAYCPISLTSTPDRLKPELQRRQQWLLSLLASSGITAYDPLNAPFSPDKGLTDGPDIIYQYDSARVGAARYVVGWDLLPSTGMGAEIEQASSLGKVVVMIHDPKVRTSRMQPCRTIHLQIMNPSTQREDLICVFHELQKWQPGIGFDEGRPCLLGFRVENGVGLEIVNLQNHIKELFPQLAYTYSSDVDIIRLDSENSGLLVDP